MIRSVLLLFALVIPVSVRAQQPSSRAMDDLNWREFQQLVPAKIRTVIVTVGTLEAHGFINNGADNTVAVAIANAIAGDMNALIARIFLTASRTSSRLTPAACIFQKMRFASMCGPCWWDW